MKKKLLQLVIIIVGISLIVSLTRNILKLLKAGDQIRLARQEAEQAEFENQQLQEKAEYYASEEFIEETARNKLNMSRPDETVVILPPNLEEIVGREEPKELQKTSNWQKWWCLFF